MSTHRAPLGLTGCSRSLTRAPTCTYSVPEPATGLRSAGAALRLDRLLSCLRGRCEYTEMAEQVRFNGTACTIAWEQRGAAALRYAAPGTTESARLG